MNGEERGGDKMIRWENKVFLPHIITLISNRE